MNFKPKIGHYYLTKKNEAIYLKYGHNSYIQSFKVEDMPCKCIGIYNDNHIINTTLYLFEFLRDVAGHRGDCFGDRYKGQLGRDKRCWFLHDYEIERELTIDEVMVEEL